jgi:hypothetical protein
MKPKPPKEVLDRRKDRPHKPKEKPSRKKQRGKMEILGFWITTASLILGAIALILSFGGPTVSLGEPLRPGDILTSQVEISNGGLLDLEDVKVIMYQKFVEYENKNTLRDGLAREFSPPSETLARGDTKTVPLLNLIGGGMKIRSADVAIIAFYRPAYMPFLRKRRAFRFITATKSDGNPILQKQPAEHILEDYDKMIANLKKLHPDRDYN